MTIIDTDILIDAARLVRQAVECLADIEQQSALAISVITQKEFLAGRRNKTELRHTAISATLSAQVDRASV